jgi:hypothetical protein
MEKKPSSTKEVGKRLEEFIQASGMNYVQFADAVAALEGPDSTIGPQTVTHWRQTGKIKRERLPLICRVLGITADELLGMSQDRPATTARIVDPLALPGAAAASKPDLVLTGLPQIDQLLDKLPPELAPQVQALIAQIVTKSRSGKLSEGDLALLISTVTRLSEDR